MNYHMKVDAPSFVLLSLTTKEVEDLIAALGPNHPISKRLNTSIEPKAVND